MSGCSLPFINTFCGHSLKNHTDYSKEPSFPQCRRVLQNHARNFRPGRTLPNVRTKPLRESRTWNERLMRLHEDRQSASFLKKTRFAKPRARFPPGAHVTERAHKAAPRKPNLERKINAASRRPANRFFLKKKRVLFKPRAQFRPGRTLPNVRTKPLRESRTWNGRLMRLHEDRQSCFSH